MSGRAWSPEEILTLRRVWPKAPIADVFAALPGRSLRGIKQKAHEQRLTRTAVLRESHRRVPNGRAMIEFDAAQAEEIQAFARTNVISFAAAVRTLVEWGIEEERKAA